MKSFDLEFERFLMGQNLLLELFKVETYLEMTFFDDLFEYVPLSSPRFDGTPMTSHSNDEPLLKGLEDYDKKKKIQEEVENIINYMDEKTKYWFIQLFIEHMDIEKAILITNNKFIYEDTFIEFCILDGNESIREEYEILKENYLKELEELKRKVDLDKAYVRYPDLLKDYKTLTKNNGAAKRKKRLYKYAVLYKESRISRKELRRNLLLEYGGRKLLKTLIN